MPDELNHLSMKNDSVSFKLVALVILAGVIAAFLDTSGTSKAKSADKSVAVVTTENHTEASQ
jgi:hypothetical protein